MGVWDKIVLDISYDDYYLLEISPETGVAVLDNEVYLIEGKSKHMWILDQRMERWRQGPDLNI